MLPLELALPLLLVVPLPLVVMNLHIKLLLVNPRVKRRTGSRNGIGAFAGFSGLPLLLGVLGQRQELVLLLVRNSCLLNRCFGWFNYLVN
jgi:hypothetical protein